MSFNNYTEATRDLQRVCDYKLSRVRVLYNSGDGRPAQRYTDRHGIAYRPWQGVTGGPWIKGKKTSAKGGQ